MKFLLPGLAAALLVAAVLPAAAASPLTPTRPLPSASHWLEPPPDTAKPSHAAARPARHVEHRARYARHRRHHYRRHRHYRFARRHYRGRASYAGVYGGGYAGDPFAYVGMGRLEASTGGP